MTSKAYSLKLVHEQNTRRLKMKLIRQMLSETKKVKYFNLELTVPVWANYLFTCRSGEVEASEQKPTLRKTRNNAENWTIVHYSKIETVAKVELEGLDFRNSLIKI